MLPRKGLRPALATTNRLLNPSPIRQNKQFSTSQPTTSSISRWRSARAFPQIHSRTRPSLASSVIVTSIYAPRFYTSGSSSTNPSFGNSASAAATDAPSSIPYDTALPAYEEVKNLDFAFGANEGHMGYLKELGLDFGWGPTTCMQYMLEGLHTGFDGLLPTMPWWAAIAMSTVVIRVALAPLYKTLTNQTAMMQALGPIINPIRVRQMEALRTGQTEMYKEITIELRDVYRRSGYKFKPSGFLPIILQALSGYGTWHLLRVMGQLPVPSLLDGGFGWISNLAVCDPYFILPIGTAILMHYSGKRTMETSANPIMSGGWQKNVILYALPIGTFAISAWMPAGVQLYIASTSILMRVQNEMLRNATIRRAFGIMPLIEVPPPPKQKAEKPQTPSAQYQKPNRTIDAKLSTPAPELKDSPEKFSVMKPWTWTSPRKAGEQLSPDELYKKRAERYEKQRQSEIKERKRRS